MEPWALPCPPAKLQNLLVLYSPASAPFSCFPLLTGSSVPRNSALHEALVDHTYFRKSSASSVWSGLIVKNTGSSLAATWMDLEGIMQGEISQTEKGKYCMISFTCGILKIQQISD